MARRFDIRDPQVKAGVDRHREQLKSRTMFDVEVLHYFHADGKWTCLDIGIQAEIESALDVEVAAALSSFSAQTVLPCSPPDLWLRMVNAESLPDRLLHQVPPRGIYLIGRAEEKPNA